MKQLRYEWNKLCGARYVWVLVALLFVLSILLSYATTGVRLADVGQRHQLTQTYTEFIAYYAEHPDEVRAAMQELEIFDEEQAWLDTQAHYAGQEYVKQEWVNRYGSDVIDDRALFAILKAAMEKPSEYRATIEKVIRDARNNYNELLGMGISPDSQSCRYQLAVEKIYSERLADVRIGIEYSHGWDTYFSNQTTDLLILCALIFLASIIFPVERQRGMLPILRCTRHGRVRAAMSKTALLLLTSAGITLAFSLTSFGVFAGLLGLSSPQNAIQSLSDFTLCQYSLSIGEYFALHLSIKVLAACAFSVMLAILSIAISHLSLMLLSMVALLGSQLLLYFNATKHVLLQFNTISAMALSTTRRYYGISLFDSSCDAFGVLLFVSLLLLTSGAALSMLLFSRVTVSAVRIGALERAWSYLGRQAANIRLALEKKRSRRRYVLSLFAVEGYKTLLASRLLLPVLALLLICGSTLLQSYQDYRISVDDAVYREYMTRWEGEISEQTLSEITQERARIDRDLAAYAPAKAAYRAGEISADEYSEITRAYFEADVRDEILRRVEDEADRLQRLAARGGANGWLLYDTGMHKLLGAGDTALLYVLTLLLLVSCYPNEHTATGGHNSGFFAILQTTKRGRNATFFAKLGSSLVLTTVLYLLCAGFEAALILRNYQIPDAWQAPLVSLAAYDSVANAMTLGEGLALTLALRGVAYGILAALTVAFSALLRRVLSTTAAVLLLTVLPYLLTRFGIEGAHAVSFVRLTTVTELLSTLCARDGAPGGIWAVYAAVLLLCALAFLLAWLRLHSYSCYHAYCQVRKCKQFVNSAKSM